MSDVKSPARVEATPGAPLTEDELRAVYAGPHAEAAIQLIFGAQDGMTIGEVRDKLRAMLSASPPAEALPSQTSGAEAPETKGPYEPRICKGMPTNCCDYGVVSLSEGREVCRVWREQDARAIAAALARPASEPAGGGDEFWTPKRISHVLSDCATYFRTLYKQHKIGPADRGIDPDKLDVASRAAALSSPASSSPAEAAGREMAADLPDDRSPANDKPYAQFRAEHAPAEAEALQAGVEAVRSALKAIIADWDERSVGEHERWIEPRGDHPGYWSPNARMVSSECIAAGRVAISSAPAQEDGDKDLSAHPRGSGQSAGEVEFVQPGAKKAGDRISLPGGWYFERYNDDGVVFSLRTPSGRGFGIKGTGCGLYTETAQSFAKAMWQANEVRS